MTRTLRLALLTFVVGFVTEAATEIYQFASYGFGRPGWAGFYYIGLATTGLGFYLMYRGRHEWTDLHHRRVVQGHRLLWAAIGIFVGSVAVLAAAGTWGAGSASPGPLALVEWLIGGLVALSFGNFFLSLVTLVRELVGRLGRTLAWAGFGWALGVAVLTGYVVGRDLPTLLSDFVTNPWALVVSFAPLAFVIAPLYVTYILFAAAYGIAYHRLRRPEAAQTLF